LVESINVEQVPATEAQAAMSETLNQSTTKPMSNELQKTTPTAAAMEYVPFGASDKIKLTLDIVKTVIAKPTKSGKTCSTRDALNFMVLCQTQRLNPLAGDAFLVGYDKFDKASGASIPVFSLITAHQAFLKRAETCQEYEGMDSGIILLDGEDKTTDREGDFRLPNEIVVGGWAKVYRKGRRPTHRRLAISAMKPAYETPFWNNDKAPGQIVKCAEADAPALHIPHTLGWSSYRA